VIWSSGARIALRNLRAHRLRTLLTMLGIIIGVAAVITMMAIGYGAQRQISDKISSLGSNLVMIQPGSSMDAGVQLGSGTRHTLTDEDASAIFAEIPTVDIAAPAVSAYAQVVKGNRNWNTLVTGSWPSYLVARDWSVSSGRHFSWEEEQASAKVALLGETVAQQLFANERGVGEIIRIDDTPFTVIGILQQKGETAAGRNQDDGIFIPLSTAKLRLVGSGHRVNAQSVHYILVKALEPDDLEAVQTGIRLLLRQRHQLEEAAADDFKVRDLAAAHGVYQESTQVMSLLLAAVASISLVVGGVGIMNIMLASVAERTRETGLRMAVGARARDIRNQFLVEAVIICLAGGIVGVIIGGACAAIVATATGWPVLLGLRAVALATSFSVAIGIAFGLYPAIKASRLDPIEALRRE
jgi:putative ABC transport system permease protein